MYAIKNVMTGLYLNKRSVWVRDKSSAARFARYVDAFNSRPAGGMVVEL